MQPPPAQVPESQVTSEELFGDVIKGVEQKIVKGKEPGTSPKIDIGAALGEPQKAAEPAKPSAPPQIPKIDIPRIEKPAAKAEPEAKSSIDKKLEETLSGVKLKSAPAKKAPEMPEVKLPEPPKPAPAPEPKPLPAEVKPAVSAVSIM